MAATSLARDGHTLFEGQRLLDLGVQVIKFGQGPRAGE
jgi:hypothetical protein